MDYPEMDHDESILLETQNIKFKSILFDAILTNKRIILVDNKKHIIPQQEITLATISHVESGENAIRDNFIILSLITGTGEKHQLVLTFARQAGGERKRECNEWTKVLKGHTPSSLQEDTHTAVPASGEMPVTEPGATVPSQAGSTGSPSRKKKIEIARPLKTIVETGPVPPKPVETSSLPYGSFCSRCGNRVPPESEFCNRCGTRIIPPGKPDAVPEPVAPPAVPQVQVPVSSVVTPAERPVRPIEQIIHSIEPLIEDSVPRTEPAPLVPRQIPQQPAEPAPAEPPAGSPDKVVWPTLSISSEDTAAPAPAAIPPVTPAFPPAPPSSPKKPRIIAIAVLAIVILAVSCGIFLFTRNPQETPAGSAGPVATPPLTAVATTMPTPEPQPSFSPMVTTVRTLTPAPVNVPPTGVWVRVKYPGPFTGLVGIPGSQREVSESGDHDYQISTSEGIVAVSLQKKDGSADELAVEAYKNGNLIKRAATVVPRGTIDFQVDLKPAPTPTPTPLPTSTINVTSTTAIPNTTGSNTSFSNTSLTV